MQASVCITEDPGTEFTSRVTLMASGLWKVRVSKEVTACIFLNTFKRIVHIDLGALGLPGSGRRFVYTVA